LKAQHVLSGIPLIIRSSKTVFAASGLYTHVVTGCCPGWVGTQFPPSLELLVMSGMPLETCSAFNQFWIINYITRLHLVGYFYWFILRCTDPWILNT